MGGAYNPKSNFLRYICQTTVWWHLSSRTLPAFPPHSQTFKPTTAGFKHKYPTITFYEQENLNLLMHFEPNCTPSRKKWWLECRWKISLSYHEQVIKLTHYEHIVWKSGWIRPSESGKGNRESELGAQIQLLTISITIAYTVKWTLLASAWTVYI